MKSLLLIIMLFVCSISRSQIDTSIVYPLQTGNLWEYTNYFDSHFCRKVIGEVIKENGKTYSEIMSINLIEGDWWDTSYIYYRLDGKKIYKFWRGVEQLEFDLTLDEGESWLFGNDSSETIQRGKIVSTKNVYYEPWIEDSTYYYFFEEIWVDFSDNPPDTTILIDAGYSGFSQGIGTVFTTGGELTGAVIGDQQYGFITVGVEELLSESVPDRGEISISAYPNPFNNTTNIYFINPRPQNIKIKVVNILGQEILIVFDGMIDDGKQNVPLYMPANSGSGIYFIHVKTATNHYTSKILYLK